MQQNQIKHIVISIFFANTSSFPRIKKKKHSKWKLKPSTSFDLQMLFEMKKRNTQMLATQESYRIQKTFKQAEIDVMICRGT